MKNTGQIVKVRSEVPFAQIPNQMLRDNRMSMKSKALLSFLLSLPADWVIYKTSLTDYFSDGYTAISNAWDELVEMGYILSVRIINEKRQFEGWNHIVYYEPQSNEELTGENGKPHLGKADFTKPQIGKPTTTNIDSINIDSTKKDNTNKDIYPTFEKPKKAAKTYPNEEEFIAYFEEKGYKVEAAKKAYHYYADHGWMDSNGKKVVNWKQKVSVVWFKPENEKPKANGYEHLAGYKAHLHNNPQYRFRLSPSGMAINYERI